MQKLFLSIIIPTHNNARTFALTLLDIRHHLERFDFRHEIIIVDDHSHDGTLEVARRFATLMQPIQILSYAGPCGILGAIRYGARVARGNYFFIFPATGEAMFDEIEKMLPRVASNQTQIVFGARRRILISWEFFLTKIRSFLAGILLRDPATTYFLIRSDVVTSAFPRLTTSSFPLAFELARLARTLGYCYAEIPLSTHM